MLWCTVYCGRDLASIVFKPIITDFKNTRQNTSHIDVKVSSHHVSSVSGHVLISCNRHSPEKKLKTFPECSAR